MMAQRQLNIFELHLHAFHEDAVGDSAKQSNAAVREEAGEVVCDR
jgi:hypothetical protein